MSAQGSALRLETRRHDADLEILRVAGDVDASNAHELQDALAALLLDRVVLDLSEVGYIDSAGVRALDRGLVELVRRGGAYRAVAPDGSPARLTLRVSGYDAAFVVEDVETAVLGLQG
jgi:stage II sporulation protein AA (anti-sigma F factor antagonist)